MRKLPAYVLFAFMGASFLTACVTAQMQGHALVADAPPRNQVRILVVPSVALRRNKRVTTIFPALAERLPLDFKHNGVEASSTLLDFDSVVPPPADVRTLVFSPTESGSFSGGSWLDFTVTLNDARLGRLWQGKLRLASDGFGSYDSSAVDHAAIPLLEQLRDAKLIDISWRRPETP